MATLRERRRERSRTRNERTPGVYRGGLEPPSTQSKRTTRQQIRDSVVSARAFSALIVVALGIALATFFLSGTFYVSRVTIVGTEYLDQREVLSWADVSGVHVFWLDANAVRQDVLRAPAIADAEVTVGWPPEAVRIDVVERQPALLWIQNDGRMWIDNRGNVLMEPPQDRADLLVVVTEFVEGTLTLDDSVSADVVIGARQLRELFPDRNQLRYHRDYGLGLVGEGGWDVWFGSGTDMPTKLRIYETLVDDLNSRGITPSVISLVNTNAPHYCILPEGCSP